MNFKLHPNLMKKPFVIDLELCSVLLEDNQYYPWIFLVPRKNNISKIMDLDLTDQYQLIWEIDKAQKVLCELFTPDQVNVAAIGNKTPQLHIHVIARYTDDPAWPATVWDHEAHKPYPDEAKKKIIHDLANSFNR